MKVWTPWWRLDSGFSGPVLFAISAESAHTMMRCDPIGQWAPQRDSSGRIQTELEAVAAPKDGCVDVGEGSKALAHAMTVAGVTNDYLTLSAPGTTHGTLAAADRQRLVDRIYEMATK